jgi:hypothetical protein
LRKPDEYFAVRTVKLTGQVLFYVVEWRLVLGYSFKWSGMRCVISKILAAICGGLMALALAGCGEDSSTSRQPAAKIQGELITPTATAPAQPKETAIAAATQPIVATATTPSIPTPTSTPAAAVVQPTTTKIVISKDGCPTVGFDKLASYNFDVPDDEPVTNKPAGPDKADDQIPATVKTFDQKKVSIKGFMLPLKVDNGSVTEFLILKDQSMCCYGNVPKITEWVSVKTTSKGMKPVMDVPVSIEGTLHVGAMRENGYLVGIYHMDGDKMVDGN